MNRAVYGTFAIVDIKGVFEDAFESLESVVPNVDLPYAAVSKGVRNKIYRVSPTFAELGQYFDMPGSPLEGYKQPSCSFYPSLCGDYATGWFMWALRDAVALRGGYSTARAASNFYSKMRNEIKRACNSGTISCYHNPVPFMPRFEPGEIYRIPASFESASKELLFIIPPSQDNANSIGLEDQIRSASSFLNAPYHTPPPPIPEAAIDHPASDFAAKVRAFVIRKYSKLSLVLVLLGLCSARLTRISLRPFAGVFHRCSHLFGGMDCGCVPIGCPYLGRYLVISCDIPLVHWLRLPACVLRIIAVYLFTSSIEI